MSEFKLCEKAGLNVALFRVNDEYFFPAKNVEALLASAQLVVRHAKEHGQAVWYYANKDSASFVDETHTARLLLIEPLVRESEEVQLLREYLSKDLMRTPVKDWLELKGRCRAFLDRHDGGAK